MLRSCALYFIWTFWPTLRSGESAPSIILLRSTNQKDLLLFEKWILPNGQTTVLKKMNIPYIKWLLFTEVPLSVNCGYANRTVKFVICSEILVVSMATDKESALYRFSGLLDIEKTMLLVARPSRSVLYIPNEKIISKLEFKKAAGVLGVMVCCQCTEMRNNTSSEKRTKVYIHSKMRSPLRRSFHDWERCILMETTSTFQKVSIILIRSWKDIHSENKAFSNQCVRKK